jgi:D-alanyl-D-alanine carboxypeptidase (penicillin-binding protein 5/6)
MDNMKSLTAALLLFLTTFSLQTQSATPIPAPPKVAASGYLLMDFDSGRLLAEQNSEQRLEPASLTKIMTTYVVLRELQSGNLALTDQVQISEKAWRTAGSRMFIEVGKKITVEELLKGMIIQSGNDASVALAEHIAGSEEVFAEMMNSQARRLDMTNTHFVNSTGLPHEEHYTTAQDIAKVSRATIAEFPDYYPWYAIKEYTFNNIKQYNRNKLLWRDKSVDGIKTGHTENAGYCLVASAQRENMRLISVVMGTASEDARARESQALLNYGFRFFETHRLYTAGQSLNEVRVWKGELETLEVGVSDDLFITIPRRQYDKLKAEMSVNSKINAPVQKGQRLGLVKVSLEGEAVLEVPLVALQDVAEGSFWQRASDAVLLWFE